MNEKNKEKKKWGGMKRKEEKSLVTFLSFKNEYSSNV
jgi:hypothetical protein